MLFKLGYNIGHAQPNGTETASTLGGDPEHSRATISARNRADRSEQGPSATGKFVISYRYFSSPTKWGTNGNTSQTTLSHFGTSNSLFDWPQNVGTSTNKGFSPDIL